MAILFPDTPPYLKHTTTLRSRYGETDQMGYVYYGNYLQYFEVARTEMIRDLGLSYAKLEELGIMLPVVHAEVDYKEPLYYDELFKVHTFMFREPTVRLETWYQISDESGEKIKAVGQVTLVFMDAASRRPVRMPSYFMNGLKNSHSL